MIAYSAGGGGLALILLVILVVFIILRRRRVSLINTCPVMKLSPYPPTHSPTLANQPTYQRRYLPTLTPTHLT